MDITKEMVNFGVCCVFLSALVFMLIYSIRSSWIRSAQRKQEDLDRRFQSISDDVKYFKTDLEREIRSINTAYKETHFTCCECRERLNWIEAIMLCEEQEQPLNRRGESMKKYWEKKNAKKLENKQ